jgi:hypothetical protein
MKRLKVEPVNPRDDGYHGNINFLDIEWWYFDSIFNNGYSVHVGLRTYHLKDSGIIQSRINIYKEGKAIVEAVKTNLFSNLNISSDRPLIQINDKAILDFDFESYKKKGEWKYTISLAIGNYEVNLSLVGITNGWKVETEDTCWAVPLPKAKVEGYLKIKDRKISVQGIGYHDHNWGYSLTTSLNNLGWFWGRIMGESLSLTWAKTMETLERGDLLAVINKDFEGFFNIPPTSIIFTPSKFVHYYRHWIPTSFKLQINNNKVSANICMETVDVQRSKIFTINYWRYHVKSRGEITFGSRKEVLKDKPQIVEFLSFKPQYKRVMKLAK